jgi:hypothetical protein
MDGTLAVDALRAAGLARAEDEDPRGVRVGHHRGIATVLVVQARERIQVRPAIDEQLVTLDGTGSCTASKKSSAPVHAKMATPLAAGSTARCRYSRMRSTSRSKLARLGRVERKRASPRPELFPDRRLVVLPPVSSGSVLT